jgi:hypothetical protein
MLNQNMNKKDKKDKKYDDTFDKMMKARVVCDYLIMGDMGDMDDMSYDDKFDKMTKARVVNDYVGYDDGYDMGIYLTHPSATIIKNFSNMVQKSPIIEVSKIFNHNKIKKPRDNRKLGRISARGISTKFLKRFIIPNYDGSEFLF